MTGFFALEPVPVDPAGWTTLAEIAADPRPRVTAARVALGTDDERAAASVDFLGLCARVLSPAVAALTDGVVPVPRTVWWRAAPPDLAHVAYADVERAPLTELTTVVEPVLDAYRAAFSVSAQVLRGNVASALAGAAAVLGSAPVTVAVADALTTGALERTARSLPPSFVRTTCCLYYRVPGAGLCGDCVLRVSGRGR